MHQKANPYLSISWSAYATCNLIVFYDLYKNKYIYN